MVDVTRYLRDKGFNAKEKVRLFLKMSKVKYIIKSNSKFKVERIPGRYGGTKMSSDLFEIMERWLKGEPLPQLNRKEYEVSSFVNEFFKNKVFKQHKVGDYIVDWFIPEIGLVVEFFEKEHKYKKEYDKERLIFISKKFNVFIVYEDTVMENLAQLAIKFKL
ncbi:MAG: DUF559 domain-containing protein [Algoriella sp.]